MWRRAVTARLHWLLASTSNWSRVVLGEAWWYCAAFTWIQRRFKSKWKNPDRCWSEPRCHCIQFDRPIHTQFYRAWSPYDYCDCKCGRICRGSSRWVPFSTIFRQTQMLDVNWCGCIHERLKFRRWKSCENLWVSNGFYPRSFWMTSVHWNGKWMAGYLLSL